MKSHIVHLLLILLLLSSSVVFAEDTTDTSSNQNATAQKYQPQVNFFPIPFAFGYLIDLAEDTTVRKPWWARLKLGFQHDDNVIMNSKGVPLPPDIPQKDDTRFIADLNAKYMFYKSQRFETAISYSLFQSIHNELDDFNVTQNMGELMGQYSITPYIDLKAVYTFHHMLIGGDTFDTAHMVGPTLKIKESPNLATHIEYKYRDTDYKDVTHFAYNSERTGENNLVGITQYVIFPAPAMLRIGYSTDKETTRQEYLDSTGNKGLIGLTIMPSATLLMDFSWEYSKRDYKDVNPYTNAKRSDTTAVMTFTATQHISDIYWLNMRLYYMQNNSNLEQFDVTRFVPSLMLEMKY